MKSAYPMKLTLALLLACLSAPAFAQHGDPRTEIAPFLKGTERIFCVSTADLNGDGLPDYLVVLEKPGDPDQEGYVRELVIMTRQKDRSLRIAKRNRNIVMCSKCGGGWGDAFHEDYVSAGTKSFSIENYGGGGSRWLELYKFNYSSRDKTWQLVEVTVRTENINDPEDSTEKVYKPPRDFGKIDIADFDPANFLGVGQR